MMNGSWHSAEISIGRHASATSNPGASYPSRSLRLAADPYFAELTEPSVSRARRWPVQPCAAAAATASCATGIFRMSEWAPENGSPAVLSMTLAALTR
jgi:hypothetical protein